MEEKKIIEGKVSTKKVIVLLEVGIVLLVITIMCYVLNIQGVLYSYFSYFFKPSFTDFLLYSLIFYSGEFILTGIILYVGLICTIGGILRCFKLSKLSLTVTDKRVYGTTYWGKRVDLPIDSVTAVGTSAFHGIDVATSSGAIKFKEIDNNIDIHKEVSALLMARQTKTVETTAAPKSDNSADQILKLKELLDAGILTQEEFDKKKKDLLSL